jgi:hypothetical protein
MFFLGRIGSERRKASHASKNQITTGLQRALNTRNRDTRDPVALEALCKLGCNCDESMFRSPSAMPQNGAAMWRTAPPRSVSYIDNAVEVNSCTRTLNIYERKVPV